MTKRAVTYSTYLALDEVLGAQRPLSVGPDGRPEHDELLFIVIHQVYELWFKQLLHELAHVQHRLAAGDTPHALHTLRRVLEPYEAGGDARARIEAAMSRPSLYDSFLAYLAAAGYDVPPDALARDVGAPPEPSPAVQRVLVAAYRDDGGPAQVAERLVDLDEGLQEWRYRHVKMVERTLGAKPGTGGSPGVAYLRTTLSPPAFPDLWAIRSDL